MLDPRYRFKNKTPRRQGKQYDKARIQSASKLDLMIMTLNLGIDACKMRDHDQVGKTLKVLKDALHPEEYLEFTLGLLRLYKWSDKMLEQEKFDDIAREVFIPLRNAWMVLRERLAGQDVLSD